MPSAAYIRNNSPGFYLVILFIAGQSYSAQAISLRAAAPHRPGKKSIFCFFGYGDQCKGGASSDVRVPKADRRLYRREKLHNGLDVLAVQDPEASKAGFAMAVSAGSYYDPPQLPGLAHFCEHLLFLGTEKYPDESSFDAFLAEHDGEANAWTDSERTVYHNELSLESLSDGLDRFAQFFIAPLFKDELVQRELNAVNSEHTKNMPDQDMRLWELIRGTAGNESVVGRFSTGTAASLKHGKGETIKALKKYHKMNYCAPRMNLVIVTNSSLDDQMALAKQHFINVPNGSLKRFADCTKSPHDFADDPGFKEKSKMGRFVQIKSNSVPQLWFLFPMPPSTQKYSSQPGQVLEYLLGYEGHGSLKSYLVSEGLISELYVDIEGGTAGTLTYIMYELTPAGVADQESLHSATFAYLAKLQSLITSNSDVLNEIYLSMKELSAVTFDYQEGEDSLMDVVSDLAEAAQLYGPQDVLAGSVMIDEIDMDFLANLIDKLQPNNVNVALATPEFKGDNANKYNQYYKLSYSEESAPEWMLEAWTATADSLPEVKIPPALKFVPSDLEILEAEANVDVPTLLKGPGSLQLWWFGGGQFKLPKATLHVKLAVPNTLFQTPRFYALRQLHVELSTQALEAETEDLAYCGLSWGAWTAGEGYELSVSGYNEHVVDLVKLVAVGFSNPFTSGDVNFTRAQQRLQEKLEDVSSSQPYELASQILSATITNSAFTRQALLTALDDITQAEFVQYLVDLTSDGLHIQALTTGNVDEAASHNLAQTLIDQLGPKKLLAETDAAINRVAMLKEELTVEVPNPIEDDDESAIINTYQYGVPDLAERVHLLMIGQMIEQPVYDTLRTQQQLGYIVFASVVSRLNTMELRVIVQGNKEEPSEVDKRIEEVLENFGQDLEKLSDSEFQKWKQAARSNFKEKDLNSDEESDRLWGQVTNGQCFNFQQDALQYLDTMDSPRVLSEAFKKLFRKERKVSVRLGGGKHSKKASLLQQKRRRSQEVGSAMAPLHSAAAAEWHGGLNPRDSDEMLSLRRGRKASLLSARISRREEALLQEDPPKMSDDMYWPTKRTCGRS